MSHVTEGELHAYIDGVLGALDEAANERIVAHIEACDDCRGRLEAATEVRDRASTLLDASLSTPVEVPPFEDVLARAGLETDGTASADARPPRTRRLAWAASIAVALGAGWMANASLRDAGSSLAMGERADSDPPAPRAVAESNARERLELGDAPESTRIETAPTSPLGREESTQRLAARDEPRLEAERETGDALPRRAGESSAGFRSSVEPPPRNRPASGVVAAPPTAEPGASAALQKAAEDPNAVGLAPEELEELPWRRVEVIEAAEWVGGILTLPDVDVEEYALADHEGRRLARVRQRLPGGETFELVQLGGPPGLDASADEVLDDLREAPRRMLDRDALVRAGAVATRDRSGAYSMGWIDVGGVQVRASAAVAPDSLRALISRVRRP
ncbi:MAG: zf-HC2 domain-containing protein [Gemmatimonadetes bacterium]|nr:zf-HC2 domain-containing protein [Gemmatimonadota bacterium]